VHTIQDKDYEILIMCNQSNAMTCLKWKAKLYIFLKVVVMYLKNLNLFKMGQHPPIQVLMINPKKLRTLDLENLELDL